MTDYGTLILLEREKSVRPPFWKNSWIYAHVLMDFSLTVKAATFIFISGRCSAISSATEGKSGSIYKLFGLRKRVCIS